MGRKFLRLNDANAMTTYNNWYNGADILTHPYQDDSTMRTATRTMETPFKKWLEKWFNMLFDGPAGAT